MKKVAIIGFGVLGKQVLHFLKESNEIEKLLVFDDFVIENDQGATVLPLKNYAGEEFKDYDFHIGIGYKHLAVRKEIVNQLKLLKRSIPSLIHPSCYISPHSTIHEACILFPKCNIDQNVVMASGNILHNSVTVSHDCTISECNYFSPSVTLCGNVQIGTCSFIGAGTTLSNGVAVGDNVRIGVASCITKKVDSDTSVIGNPQRILNKKLQLL